MASTNKNWWEQDLDWTLSGSYKNPFSADGKPIGSIADAVSAYRLGQPSHVATLPPDPVARISAPRKRLPAVTVSVMHLPAVVAPSKKGPTQDRPKEKKRIPLGTATPPAVPAADLIVEQMLEMNELPIEELLAALGPVATPLHIELPAEHSEQLVVIAEASTEPPTPVTQPAPEVVAEAPAPLAPKVEMPPCTDLSNWGPTIQEIFDQVMPPTAVERAARNVVSKHLTLEQLLDPDFCDYIK